MACMEQWWCFVWNLHKKLGIMKNVIRLVVAEARLSKVYPKDIKKYLMGLYASLHLKDSEKDMERLIYYAFKNGYVLGAASQGAEAQEVSDRLPDLGIEGEASDDIER